MLKNNTTLPSPIALISVVAVLIIALGAVALIKWAPAAPSLPVQVGNPASASNPEASVSPNQPAARSVHISTETLRRWLDDAYERHQTMRVQTLQDMLNGRYERRVGLPY